MSKSSVQLCRANNVPVLLETNISLQFFLIYDVNISSNRLYAGNMSVNGHLISYSI